MCCPPGFLEEFFALSQVTMSQIGTRNDKNTKCSIFRTFYFSFQKFSTDFVNWNVEKGQQGKIVLSSMHEKEDEKTSYAFLRQFL